MTRTVPNRAKVRTVPRFTFAGRGSRDPRREPRRRRAVQPQPSPVAATPSATHTAPV